MIVAIDVEDAGWEAVPDLEVKARAAIAAVLAVSALPKGEHEVSVLFAGDDDVAALNKAWRGKDGPTNVLSFPAEEFPVPEGEAKPLGDIVLALGVVTREAEAQGKRVSDHAVHLVVHGMLHLLGHDHIEADEAAAMEELERLVLGRLGIADPYDN